jgi:hypothetical protein
MSRKPEDLPVNRETLSVEEGGDEVNQGAILRTFSF